MRLRGRIVWRFAFELSRIAGRVESGDVIAGMG